MGSIERSTSQSAAGTPMRFCKIVRYYLARDAGSRIPFVENPGVC
jgi:hypothetical protein